MKQAQISSDPPLPDPADYSPEARPKQRGAGALFLAIFGLVLELLPGPISAFGGYGRFAFSMMGVAGGLIAVAAIIRALMTPSNITTARWAMALGSLGVGVWMYHPHVCLAVARFFIAVRRGF
jgi:hypothetical protein